METMRKIIAITQVTLDGIIQAPGGPQEDPTNGFTHGGWAMPFADHTRGLPGSGERVRARRHETGPRLARISGARPLLNAGHIHERAEHEHRRQATETIQSVPKLAVDGHHLRHRSGCYLVAGVRQLGMRSKRARMDRPLASQYISRHRRSLGSHSPQHHRSLAARNDPPWPRARRARLSDLLSVAGFEGG